MEYCSTIIKNEIIDAITRGMDLEGIMLNAISQRKTKIVRDLTYMWNLKNKKKMNKLNQTKRAQIQRIKYVVAR